MAQIETRPPRFALQVNNRNRVTRDYVYFLENRLRARFGLDGVPVIIDVHERKDRHGDAVSQVGGRRGIAAAVAVILAVSVVGLVALLVVSGGGSSDRAHRDGDAAAWFRRTRSSRCTCRPTAGARRCAAGAGIAGRLPVVAADPARPAAPRLGDAAADRPAAQARPRARRSRCCPRRGGASTPLLVTDAPARGVGDAPRRRAARSSCARSARSS